MMKTVNCYTVSMFRLMQWRSWDLNRNVRSSVTVFKGMTLVAGYMVDWRELKLAERGPLEGICHS